MMTHTSSRSSRFQSLYGEGSLEFCQVPEAIQKTRAYMGRAWNFSKSQFLYIEEKVYRGNCTGVFLMVARGFRRGGGLRKDMNHVKIGKEVWSRKGLKSIQYGCHPISFKTMIKMGNPVTSSWGRFFKKLVALVFKNRNYSNAIEKSPRTPALQPKFSVELNPKKTLSKIKGPKTDVKVASVSQLQYDVCRYKAVPKSCKTA